MRNSGRLLQIIAKRVIVGADGEMVDYELHSPFAYLHMLVSDSQSIFEKECGSDQIRLGLLKYHQPDSHQSLA